MAIRYLKTVLTAAVALMGVLYALQNLANLDEAFFAVAHVLRMEGQEVYPRSLGPAVTAPALIWIALGVIIMTEFAIGFLAGKGTWDLWRARKGGPEAFDAAKTFAVLGCGAAVLLWFGFFLVIGGGYFQMWQTEIGQASFADASRMAAMAGLVLLIVNAPER